MDQARYDAIRERLEDALADAENEGVRHDIRNALQLLVREWEEGVDD